MGEGELSEYVERAVRRFKQPGRESSREGEPEEEGKQVESGLIEGQLETGEQQRIERWDPRQRVLLVETSELLESGLQEAAIRMAQGRITVEGTNNPNPSLITRLLISAQNEEEARKYLQQGPGEFEIEKGKGSISVESRHQEGLILEGGNVVVSSGSVVIAGGEVWIGGRKVSPTQDRQIAPTARREVVLLVPESDKPRSNLEIGSGDIVIRNTGGEYSATTRTGNINIERYKGDARLNSTSGDIKVRSFEGDLFAQTSSGDINIYKLQGSANIGATSGDVKIEEVNFRGSNSIRATSGDIRVGITNDSLSVSARTSSGAIRTGAAREHGFIITQKREPERGVSGVIISEGIVAVSIGGAGGESLVEGRFGQGENPVDSLTLNATSGDITIA